MQNESSRLIERSSFDSEFLIFSYEFTSSIVTVAAISCLLEKLNLSGNGSFTKALIGH